MAVKRSFNISDKKGRSCLKCGRTLPAEDMKDNTVCTCVVCGQRAFVDRHGSSCTMTVYERPELRRRPKIVKDERDVQIEQLKAELAQAQEEAKQWESAADGLAKMIEEMKAQKQ